MSRPEAELREVGEGLFSHVQFDGSWWINSSGVIASGDEVILIDSCATRARATALRERVIARLGSAPSILVNTHAHGDHTYGNEVFAEATIVAHSGCRSAMANDPVRWSESREWWTPTPAWEDLELKLPTVTIEATTTIWCGDRKVTLIPTGRTAHTDHDVVVVCDDIAFTGDLIFNGGTPLFVAGSLTGYLETVPMLRELGVRSFVPGHGEPCGVDELNANEKYVRFVLESAREGLAQGLDPLSVAREVDLGEFAERTDPERIVLNMHRAFAELDPTFEMQLPRAFADAITYNGGPLHTHA